MLVGTAPVWGPGTFTPPTVPKNLRPKSLTVISAGPAPNAASNAAYTASIAFDAVANSRSIRDENPAITLAHADVTSANARCNPASIRSRAKQNADIVTPPTPASGH